ncbi:Bor family protein [Serratia liquefaciens]|uniref:Bor family protein n=1 Tax=Serratia liquefaciens TaxID=614 RepID=UPI0021B10D3C|nr:Bor family protein [Serratia liquefaciens]
MKKIYLLGLIILLSGCAKQGFNIKEKVPSTPEKEVTHHFFISGLGQEKNIDAAAVCGGADRVARTETQLTFINGFLNVITFGIYTPREARVYCLQ